MDLGWLNTYQNLLVGAGGFLGVFVTLWYNAKTARNQRYEEREHERKALRVALIAELKINRDSLEKNLHELKNNPTVEDIELFVPIDCIDAMYQLFLPRIGLLSEDEISNVMQAYLSLQTHKADLFIIGNLDKQRPRHIKVLAREADYFAAMQEGLLNPIDQAIKALESAHDRG